MHKRHEEFSFEESRDTQAELYYGDLYTELLLSQEKAVALVKIWTDLDQRSQYLLEARYILGKSHSEIAEDLGIKVASVRMALTRARKKAYILMVRQAEGQ